MSLAGFFAFVWKIKLIFAIFNRVALIIDSFAGNLINLTDLSNVKNQCRHEKAVRKMIHERYPKWSQSIAFLGFSCVFFGGGFSNLFKKACTPENRLFMKRKRRKLLAIVEELSPKAMNNKILKCTDENINMNFLYVCLWLLLQRMCECVS